LTYQSDIEGAPAFQAYATTSSGTWLTVSPGSGTMTESAAVGLPHTSTATVTIAADPTRISPGTTLTGTVTYVAAGVTSDTTAVTMIVTSAPAFTVAPQSLSFSYTQGASSQPAAQSISASSLTTGTSFTVSASSNGNWLSAGTSSSTTGKTPGSVAVSVNGTNLSPGTFTGKVTISSGATSVFVPVTFTVVKAISNPAVLSVSPATESFSLAQGSAPGSGQVTVSNAGGGTLQFAAQATVSGSAQGWLTLSNASGSATSAVPASLSFTADPSGLNPGIYTGQITVSDTASTAKATVTVILTVTQAAPSIQLSQTGLSVTAVAGGSQPPAQVFTVANSAAGSLSWTGQVTTLSGGSWLQATPASGTSASGQSGTPVSVSASTAGLAAGQYYGSVNIVSPNASNNPQTVSVVLNVLSSQASAGETVSTGGVILSGVAGSTTPLQQTVSVFNPSSAAVSYTASTIMANGTGWLSVAPPSGSVSPGTNSIQIVLNLSGLSTGVYTGTVRLAFSDGSAATIQVVVLATGSGASIRGGLGATGSGLTAKSAIFRPLALTTCPAGKTSFLIPVFRQPVGQSVAVIAAPQTVQVEIIDDCGNPVTAKAGGLVQVTFNSGDAALNLHDVGSGIWEATWTPVHAAAPVTLQVAASEAGITLNPALNVGTSVAVTVQLPAVSVPLPTGVANAASAAHATAEVVAPGSYVAIYGTGLAGGGSPSATSLPLPTTLNGTQVLLGAIPMPLLYAGAGQVNALVPQGIAPNASYPLVVITGTSQSVPMALTVTELQPGVYTADFSGSGAGIVTNAVTAQLIDASHPAHAGDYLTIYCTGLGSVSGSNGEPEPGDGTAAPTNLLFQTTANATVTIGGVNAPVLFSGLTATLAALYQVNVQVPSGVTPGVAIPVVITVADPQTGATSQSNPVTIAVQ